MKTSNQRNTRKCETIKLPRRKQQGIVCHAGPDPASSFLSGFRVKQGMTSRRKQQGIALQTEGI